MSVSHFENAGGQWWDIDTDPNERTVRYPMPEGVVLTRNATSLELHLVEMVGRLLRDGASRMYPSTSRLSGSAEPERAQPSPNPEWSS